MTPTKSSGRNAKAASQRSAAIKALSDHELRAALKENGVSPGPITDSTRELYRNKLESIYHGLGQHEIIKEESAEDSNLDDESSDESFVVDEDELNESSDSFSEEVEEQDDEDESGSELSDADVTTISQHPSRTRFYFVSAISLLAIAASVYLYSNNSSKVYRNLTRQLLTLLALTPLVYLLYKTYRFYVTRRHEENSRVCELVSEALELLQSPENPKGLMPILHIRDTLLTPAERKSKKTIKLWQKAVKFIEDHESRVKVELVNIDGEDFRAWKWIGSRKII